MGQTANVFQHTAARRRLALPRLGYRMTSIVSTHSRPKAAGYTYTTVYDIQMFQHTAARRRLATPRLGLTGAKGFNTQPPEGGWLTKLMTADKQGAFQHTAARRRLAFLWYSLDFLTEFQHTAARRRLVAEEIGAAENGTVSTHSRPKAAGTKCSKHRTKLGFQHTAARRRLGN